MCAVYLVTVPLIRLLWYIQHFVAFVWPSVYPEFMNPSVDIKKNGNAHKFACCAVCATWGSGGGGKETSEPSKRKEIQICVYVALIYLYALHHMYCPHLFKLRATAGERKRVREKNNSGWKSKTHKSIYMYKYGNINTHTLERKENSKTNNTRMNATSAVVKQKQRIRCEIKPNRNEKRSKKITMERKKEREKREKKKKKW